MPYSSTMIANNVLSRSFSEGSYVTPMKLQKIIYFTASEYAKLTGRPLLEEPFQTFAYGPVLYSVYDEFRPFSKGHIKRYARDAKGQALVVDEHADKALGFVLDQVWSATKDLTAVALSELTHAEDSAWDYAFQNDERFLSHEQIQADMSYQDTLGIPRRTVNTAVDGGV